MNEVLAGGILIAIAVLILHSSLLAVATWIVTSWTRTVTAFLPAAIRDRRRMEMTSDLFEQRGVDRIEGFAPAEVGVRLIGRWLRGVPADLAWSLQEWHRARTPSGHTVAQFGEMIDRLESQIDHLEGMAASARTEDFAAEVESWIREKRGKIEDIQEAIRELQGKIKRSE